MQVTVQRQGNANIFTIPKNVHVAMDTNYQVYQDTDGSIVYAPEKNTYDIWADTTLDSIDFEMLRHQELVDLVYNPREIAPTGLEKPDA